MLADIVTNGFVLVQACRFERNEAMLGIAGTIRAGIIVTHLAGGGTLHCSASAKVLLAELTHCALVVSSSVVVTSARTVSLGPRRQHPWNLCLPGPYPTLGLPGVPGESTGREFGASKRMAVGFHIQRPTVNNLPAGRCARGRRGSFRGVRSR